MLDKTLKMNKLWRVNTSFNEYEQAFENWLIENHLQFVAVDQQKRRVFARNKIKSFDFFLYPVKSAPVIAEVKGRLFKGLSVAKETGLECWVTMEDIRGLIRWEQVFNDGTEALFIFAYKFENIDVETDGREVYDFDGNVFMFYVVKLDDYREFMKVRSPKWQTVTLPAEKFRELAVPARQFLFG